jgi:hypothetical protein
MVLKARKATLASRAGAGLVAGAFALAPLAADDAAATASPATFHEHVLPIFRARCIGCLGGERPKGGLGLETLESSLVGGDEGAVIVPGKPEESLLYLLISGAREPRMPPKNKGKVEDAERAVIRAWIAAGCQAGVKLAAAPYSSPLAAPVYARAPVLRALAHSADGRRLYIAGFREILVHELDDAGAPVSPRLPAARWIGEAEQINAIEISPDGGTLAAAGGNPARFGEVQLRDAASGVLRRFARIGKDTLFAAAFSDDGRRLAVSGTGRSIHVLDIETGALVHQAELHADWILGLAFDAGGAQLVSGSRDRTLKVSSAIDGKLLQSLGDLGGQVLRVVRRPGARQVLAAGESRVPVLFDLEGMKELRKFEGQPGAVLAAAFSRDGKLLAVAGAAAELRVYDADSGARKATLATPERWVYTLSFSPDGRRLAAAGHEGAVRLYALEGEREAASFIPAPIGRWMEF